MNKTCWRKIIISLGAFKLGSSCIECPQSKALCCSFRQYYIAKWQIYWTKESQQLCKIEVQWNLGSGLQFLKFHLYVDNVRQDVAMILVQFWIMPLSFSVTYLFIFSRHFSFSRTGAMLWNQISPNWRDLSIPIFQKTIHRISIWDPFKLGWLCWSWHTD